MIICNHRADLQSSPEAQSAPVRWRSDVTLLAFGRTMSVSYPLPQRLTTTPSYYPYPAPYILRLDA